MDLLSREFHDLFLTILNHLCLFFISDLIIIHLFFQITKYYSFLLLSVYKKDFHSFLFFRKEKGDQIFILEHFLPN